MGGWKAQNSFGKATSKVTRLTIHCVGDYDITRSHQDLKLYFIVKSEHNALRTCYYNGSDYRWHTFSITLSNLNTVGNKLLDIAVVSLVKEKCLNTKCLNPCIKITYYIQGSGGFIRSIVSKDNTSATTFLKWWSDFAVTFCTLSLLDLRMLWSVNVLYWSASNQNMKCAASGQLSCLMSFLRQKHIWNVARWQIWVRKKPADRLHRKDWQVGWSFVLILLLFR